MGFAKVLQSKICRPVIKLYMKMVLTEEYFRTLQYCTPFNLQNGYCCEIFILLSTHANYKKLQKK